MRTKIGQLGTVQMGYSFRSRIEASKNSTISLIQMKDLLSNGTVNTKNLTRVDIESLKIHHLAQKGDLVFRSRGLVTTSCLLQEHLRKTVVAAPLLRIRISRDNTILPEYLNWYINQKEAQMFLTSRAKGSTQKMISKHTIEELEVSVPSLNRQRRIVDLARLASQEQLILKKLANKKEQYISALLMQLTKGE